jgi:hypothetical protein
MSNVEIQNLLTKLRNQIGKSELDAETRASISELESDIHELLDSNEDEVESASILKRAREIEADFETKHPTAVRILSEIIESLSRMGF